MNLSTNALNGYVNAMNTYSGTAQADKLQSSASGITEDSSYEEIEDAAKKFEAYMLEQVIKEFKKSIDDMKGEEDDESVSQMTDIYMDQSLQSISEMMVDSYGQRLTKELADQMARNVGVAIPGEDDTEAVGEDNTKVGSDDQSGTTADDIEVNEQNSATSQDVTGED